jgi:hypothetical protein
MGPTKTERCQTCQAVVNPTWETCAACRCPLSTNEILIEPAAPNARPIYWERATTEIVGPARPEFLARVGTGPKAQYWVVAEFHGQPVWINSIVLRSKKQFVQQVKPKAFVFVREHGYDGRKGGRQ